MTNQVEPMDAPQSPVGLRKGVVDRAPVDAPLSSKGVPPMGGLHGEFANPDAPMPDNDKPAGKYFENITAEA